MRSVAIKRKIHANQVNAGPKVHGEGWRAGQAVHPIDKHPKYENGGSSKSHRPSYDQLISKSISSNF